MGPPARFFHSKPRLHKDFEADNSPINPKVESVPPPPVESVNQIQQNPEMREFFKQFLDSQVHLETSRNKC